MDDARKRILFVDDDAAFLKMLRRILREQEQVWDMAFVGGVDEALAEMRRTRFDAVVLDVLMPGKDGFELLAAIRASEATKDVPVIILTGDKDEDLMALALNLGATDLLTKPVNRENLLARIRSVLRLKGYQDALKSLNEQLEERIAERTENLEQSRLDIIWRLAMAGEYRHEETGSHVVRVGCYCRAIAERLRLSRDFVEMLFLTAPLHDIGKIGIPDNVLLKAGKLTPSERKAMQRHCEIGAEILLREPKGMIAFREWRRTGAPPAPSSHENPFLNRAATIALTHHEWWNGEGYPKRLKGHDIPIESRITALADVYDALCSTRPYKQAYPEDKVMQIMREQAGSHLDPLVYAAFEQSADEFQSIRAELPDEVCRAPQEYVF